MDRTVQAAQEERVHLHTCSHTHVDHSTKMLSAAHHGKEPAGFERKH